MPARSSLLDELAWRGLLYQHTDALADAFAARPVTAYCGFDPTASSLHVGNLVPVMGLVHLQRAGHRPIALVGGGTGMIGDPSGKTAERTLNTLETVEQNARGIRAQLERFLDFSGPSAALMGNNADWLLSLRAVDFMRDVGKHFTVNYMMAKESVKSRLETGISYTEFSYMLLQAYDYLELHRRHGATLQIGGSDQWGNITAGIELIRRIDGHEAHALTLPLVTTATGTKFGKTEAGSVWLDPSRTSPYRFYQFWINTDDRDVGRYLRFFTLLPHAEIEALEAALAAHPERREAQQALSRDVTTRVHGEAGLQLAERITAVLFGADPRTLSEPEIQALKEDMTVAQEQKAAHAAADDQAGFAADIADLLSRHRIVGSKGEARRLIQQGGIYVNETRWPEHRKTLGEDNLLYGRYAFVRKGARTRVLVEFI